jgi:hypothetical protein
MAIIDLGSSDYGTPFKNLRVWLLFSTFVPILFAAHAARNVHGSETWLLSIANLCLCIVSFAFAGLLRLVAVNGLADAECTGPLYLFRFLFQRFILRYDV